jgi:hypothetical protein
MVKVALLLMRSYQIVLLVYRGLQEGKVGAALLADCGSLV